MTVYAQDTCELQWNYCVHGHRPTSHPLLVKAMNPRQKLLQMQKVGSKVSPLKFRSTFFHPITHMNCNFITLYIWVQLHSQVTKNQIPVKTLWATVTQVKRLLISTNTWHNNIPLASTPLVSQFLGLPHERQPYEGVALGFSTWQQPPSFLRHESPFWLVAHRQEAARANSSQQVYWCSWRPAGCNRLAGSLSLQNEAQISKCRQNSTPNHQLPNDL